jgi:hypothetical protein
VFIKAPIVVVSSSSVQQICTALPKNLPTTATKIMAPVTFHKYGSLISPISVFKPVNTKKQGQQKNYRHIFYFSINIIEFRNIGHIEPIIKAPKGHEYHYSVA